MCASVTAALFLLFRESETETCLLTILCFQISYVIFLGFFCLFLLTDLHPISSEHRPSVIEYVVWGIALSLLIEEIRQVKSSSHWVRACVRRVPHRTIFQKKIPRLSKWNMGLSVLILSFR